MNSEGRHAVLRVSGDWSFVGIPDSVMASVALSFPRFENMSMKRSSCSLSGQRKCRPPGAAIADLRRHVLFNPSKNVAPNSSMARSRCSRLPRSSQRALSARKAVTVSPAAVNWRYISTSENGGLALYRLKMPGDITWMPVKERGVIGPPVVLAILV
jgi:hypothetical protein